jgi:uncharacterized protein (TIGR00255 family)
MTGYGEASSDRVRCELRSVNHRFFRTSISAPPFFSRYEYKIESLLREKLLRGMIYCNIAVTVTPQTMRCDTEIAKRYRDALLSLKESLNLNGDVSIDLLSRSGCVFKMEIDEQQVSEVWEETHSVLDKAVKELILTRREEGKKIVKDARKRIDNLDRMLRHIEAKLPERIERERLKIERLPCKDEALLLLDRINVEEEVARFQFHLSCMREIMSEKTSQGKKLLFLLQELLREANTMSNKIQDAPISRIVVDMKTEIESLREEMENVL